MMNLRLALLLVVLFVVSFFAGSVALAASPPIQKQSEFTAANTVISQSGVIGGYAFPDPGTCVYDADWDYLFIGIAGQPKASARAGRSAQKVGVVIKVYQRLAGGSLGVPFNTAEYSQTVGSSLSPVAKYQISAPLGGDYVFAYEFRWYASNGTTLEGKVEVALTSYQSYMNGVSVIAPYTPHCGSPWPESVNASPTTGTVNSKLNYHLYRYPRLVDAPITWDGLTIGSTTTDISGESHGSIKIPAAPKGPHTIRWKYGHWDTQVVYTVKPRIKVIPNLTKRGDTVNVSLRGFAAGEVVRIRWKKGASWVELTRVTTSATGSANVNVKVPKFVPDGATSVRGDSVNASGGRAQTNAVSVFGGPFSSSAVSTATPTPTSTPTATATLSPTTTATQTPEVTASPESTASIATPEASPTGLPSETPIVETPSPAPTETATSMPDTPTAEPTETAPVETPTPEPTVTSS